MTPVPASHLPYCGAPPTLATIWTRWNLDPPLIAVLIGVLALYLLAARRRPAKPRYFVAGWTIAALALVSPLCALSVSLFSARVAQHLILTMIAAPLAAIGLPRLRTSAMIDVAAAASLAAALWFWHAPAPYAATFRSVPVYWAMHLSMIAAALAFWMTLAGASPSRMARSIAAALATSLQMALLGAIIAFAAHPLYAPHRLTAWACGVSPLTDQQLGGALMWVPSGLIFVAAILAPLHALLRRAPASLASAPAG